MKFPIVFFLSINLLLTAIAFSQTEKEGKEVKDDKENKNENGSKSENSIVNNITFLNAANFDFSNSISGSYLGKLNIFAPNINGGPFGLNAGVLRIKFNYKDTSNSTYLFENRLIHPLDSIKQGTRYLREFNKFTTTKTNTVWSFYLQPMARLYEIPKKGNPLTSTLRNGIYFHLHVELLVNKTNVTTSIQNIQRDTSSIDMGKQLDYITYRPESLIYDRTLLNGYFGFGLTFDLDPFSNGNSRFFFQPTIGWTTTYPNWVSQDISSTVVTVIPTRSGTSVPLYESKSSMFYLLRTEFNQKLSDNSQLIVGTDIRGLFPKINPVYATYIGINLNLNSLINVITGKDKKDQSKNESETNVDKSKNKK